MYDNCDFVAYRLIPSCIILHRIYKIGGRMNPIFDGIVSSWESRTTSISTLSFNGISRRKKRMDAETSLG